ncbi:MAG: hypothetical protein ACREID_08805, partial [Planctomycetota bacterium]
EAIQRTERFIDTVKLAGDSDGFEIERAYLKLFTKVRTGTEERPTVVQSPLSRRTVVITEKQRRREVALKGRGPFDPLVQRTVGMELDWRDILPEGPVGPGDVWTAESGTLARRVGAHLNAGSTRTALKVRYEDNVKYEGAACVRLYVDWTLEGMRDRSLFTKVTLAGDVFFDAHAQRFLAVDLAGNMAVRGAITRKGAAPLIVNGEGQVSIQTTLKPAPVQIAVEESEGAGGDESAGEAEGARD